MARIVSDVCGTTLLFTWMNIIHFGSPLFACSLSPHVARIVSDVLKTWLFFLHQDEYHPLWGRFFPFPGRVVCTPSSAPFRRKSRFSFIRMNIIESRFSFPLSLYEGSSEMFFVSNVVFSFITMNIIHSGPSSFALSLRREGVGTHRQRRWSFVASSPALSSRRNCVLSRIQLRRRSSLETSRLVIPLSVSPPCCYLLAFVQNLRQKGSFSAADFEHLIILQNKQYFFASSDENFFTRASQVCKFFPLVLFQFWLQTARVCLLVLISSTRAFLWGNKHTAGLICSLARWKLLAYCVLVPSLPGRLPLFYQVFFGLCNSLSEICFCLFSLQNSFDSSRKHIFHESTFVQRKAAGLVLRILFLVSAAIC